MLSLRIKPIRNPKETVKYYYSKDNYYYTGSLATEWHGLAADKLNLAGEVGLSTLEGILSGNLPNGEIIKCISKNGEPRCGYDLTFSAPKSVSYMALVAGHTEFIALHEKAVKKVLNIIEREAAEARTSGEKGVEYEKTGNLCFATILHDTSRELDPQLHIHALMMNFTERLDGKWRALASDIKKNHGTMEWIMKNQIFLGLVYRSELALGLKELGLEIEHTGDAHGLFEIKHFDKDLLDKLSKRRNQIEERASEMHSSSLKAYDRAAKDTREPKKNVNPEELREKWRSESLSLGIEPSTYLDSLRQRTCEKPKISERTERNYEFTDAVMDAIGHLEEKKLSFTYQEVLQISLHFSLGSQEVDGLINQIDGAIKEHKLIAIDDEDKRFTTPSLVTKERELMEKVMQFSSQTPNMPKDTNRVIELTDNQSIQKAVVESLHSKEGVVRIKQQSATSREVLSTLIDYGSPFKKIHVLSPSSIIANQINQEHKPRIQTLWQWVQSVGKSELAGTVAGFNHQHKNDHKLPFFKSKQGQELLIVDESQRMSPDDMNHLLSIANARAAKVVFLEKPEGLSGFKSDIKGLLDKAQVKTFNVADNLSRTSAIHLVEAREKEARILKTAEQYVALSIDERKNTRVLTASKAEAVEVNEAIRASLKATGTIGLDDKTINTLTRVSLTSSEKKYAKNYKQGWVLFNITRHETSKFTIESIHESDNRIVVRDDDGVLSHLSAKSIGIASQVYEQTPISVSVGDQLIATGNLLSEGIKAGGLLDVEGFSRLGLKLRQGKKTIRVPYDAQTHLPLTHRYASTIYSSDFKAVDKTIITLPAYALRKNTLELISESSRNDVTIITDDAKKAARYAKKMIQNSSAIALTIDAAEKHYGLKKLDDDVKGELLSTLDKALELLKAEKPVKSDSEKALTFAIAHLSEREAAFSSKELLMVAITKAIGEVGIDELHATLSELTKSGDLIAADKDMLTTQEAVNFETTILETVKDGLGKASPLLSLSDANAKLEQTNLTKGQKDACQLITTTSDQFIVIQGYAGTGKTTMTRTAVDAIEHAQSMVDGCIDLIALAPTHQAVKEMKALGIESQTLKSFLIEQSEEPTLTERSMVILDESSMVSNRDCASLVRFIRDAGAKGVFLGDISQHQSIESGKPSKLVMQDGHVRVAYMDNIVRQQVVGYKNAVETLVNGDAKGALSQFEKLPLVYIERDATKAEFDFKDIQSSVVEVRRESEETFQTAQHKPQAATPDVARIFESTPIKMAVYDYLSRTKSCRDDTVVIIHENANREIANGLIRDSLMEEGTLGHENKPFSRLLSTNYTTAELYYTQTYQDCLHEPVVHFLKKDNEYYQIMAVDEVSKVVKLKDSKGNASVYMPEKDTQDWKIELFKQLPGSVSIGEKIHFKKTDKSRGRISNERAEVISVSEAAFTIKDSTGNEHTLQKDDKKDAHWDYSYTATSYSIQGASFKFVIGVADTGNEKTSHFRSFYIMVSRGSLHAMLYTDSYEKLGLQIGVVPDKTSALEVLNRVPTHIRSTHRIVEPEAIDKKTKINTVKATTQAAVHTPLAPRYDATSIIQSLNVEAERVIEHLLGKPNTKLSSKKEHRYGTNGSLSICLQGEKRGTWFNFETNEKGNLLHLIQNVLGVDFKSSLKFAADLTNNSYSEQPKEARHKEVENKQNKAPSDPSKTELMARKIARESVPISGTLAARYLKEVRGITNVSGHNIRFHPNVYTSKHEEIKYRPALIGLVRNKDHNLVAIEIIYLDEKTANKATMGIKPKKSLGPKGKGVVVLDEGISKDAITYIAEGIETGLSIRDAVKDERVIVSLGKGNFQNIDMEMISNKVVLCLDNDGKSIAHEKSIVETIDRLVKHGKEVIIAMPEKKGDFNDLARNNGGSAVISTLNKAVSIESIQRVDGKTIIGNVEIKACLDKIEKQIQLNVNINQVRLTDKVKSVQKLEMEI